MSKQGRWRVGNRVEFDGDEGRVKRRKESSIESGEGMYRGMVRRESVFLGIPVLLI